MKLNTILIIEDNLIYAKAMQKAIAAQFEARLIHVTTAQQAREVLAQGPVDLCIVDLLLPDSEGEFIEEISDTQKVIVTTAFEDEMTRKKITSLNIIDYIIKSDSVGFSYLTTIINRLIKNRSTTVLVVEDSLTIRHHVTHLLGILQLNYLEAENGQAALELIETHDAKIDLVITDYQMPVMDGLEFLKRLRQHYPLDTLPVMTLSAIGNEAVIARFLKAGANDYIIKPFSKEEFICRINLSLNNHEMLRAIKKSAITDHLTGLRNRAYLDERIEALHAAGYEENSIAVLDIDHFKSINDTYGHASGDKALQFFAAQLIEHFEKNNALRLGGEEFLVLLPGIAMPKAVLLMETFRKQVENAHTFSDENAPISFTVSIGLATTQNIAVQDALKHADKMLYKAKNKGRNRIEFELETASD